MLINKSGRGWLTLKVSGLSGEILVGIDMNKAFKVLFNDVRGSYVVSSEATKSHGKPKKALVVATAAALLMFGGAASAATITNDSFDADHSSLFISGNGDVTIQTEGNGQKLINELYNAYTSGDLVGILEAFTPHDGTSSPIGLAGGNTYIDSVTASTIDQMAQVAMPQLDVIYDKWTQLKESGHLSTINSDGKQIQGDSKVTIGGNGSNPLIIGSVAGDRVINSLMYSFAVSSAEEVTEQDIIFSRNGNTYTSIESGNVISHFAANSALNASNFDIYLALKNPSPDGLAAYPVDNYMNNTTTSVTLTGSTEVSINSNSSVLGLFGAGAALAFGGQSDSNVLGKTHIINESTVNAENLKGISLGLVGGGLALSALGGESNATVGSDESNVSTQIDLQTGISAAVVGGGIAVNVDLSPIETLIQGMELPDSLQNIGLKEIELTINPHDEIEKANATISGNTLINASSQSTSAMIMGGGIAISNPGSSSGSSNATTEGTVNITLNGQKLTDEQKGAYQDSVEKLYKLGWTTLNQIISPDSEVNVDELLDQLQTSADELNVPGVHVGNMGGGLAVARGTNNTIQSTAKTDVNNVVMNLAGGYNVANLAGGMAIAFGGSETAENEVVSNSHVGEVEINITGGDAVLVAGGGATYATTYDAKPGYNSMVSAQATVDKATINIANQDTVVDGVFGGGIAVDDTNAAQTNATTTTNDVTINVHGGTVNAADLGVMDKFFDDALSSTGAPATVGTYALETSGLVESANVAILGAGMASGGKALANTDSTTINLYGGTVEGNVFGGGAATLGAESNANKSVITIAGATIKGDIYGGGLAGSAQNELVSDSYRSPVSTVTESKIILSRNVETGNIGTVTGNIYAGGFVYDGNTTAEAKVGTSTIRLEADNIFQGKVLDGSGADKATLELAEDTFNLAGKTARGFDAINATQAQGVNDLSYEFANRSVTNVTGDVNFTSIATNDTASTLNLGSADQTDVYAIKAVEGSGLTVNLAGGLLSMATSNTTAAQSAFASAPNKAQAVGYVTGDTDRALNGTVVNIGAVSGKSGINIGADGLLIADADGSTKATVATNAGAVHFADVAQAAADESVVVLGDAVQESDVTVDNVLFKAVKGEEGFTFTLADAEELANYGLDGFDDPGFLAETASQTDQASQFINSFMAQRNSYVNTANRSQQLNAAVNLATAGGVQTAAIDGAMMGIDAAAHRASIINEQHKGGTLFAEASGKRFEMGGSSEFGEIKADLGGIVIGGEYTTDDAWTFGALANLGTGTVRGQGNNSGVRNEVDYYGVQAYAAKRLGDFNIVGQVGYLTSSNDLTHSAAIANTADVDADVISLGVRGEMRIAISDNARVVPYIGVNYLRVGTDSYTTSQGVRVDDIDQNLVTIPVGVRFAGAMSTESGWHWTPSADIGYVASFGDRDVEADTAAGNAMARTTMDVWSENVVRAGFGVKAQKDNFGIGVQAGTALGSDDTKAIFGQIRVDYRF